MNQPLDFVAERRVLPAGLVQKRVARPRVARKGRVKEVGDSPPAIGIQRRPIFP
jgi:hypothetical protein